MPTVLVFVTYTQKILISKNTLIVYILYIIVLWYTAGYSAYIPYITAFPSHAEIVVLQVVTI